VKRITGVLLSLMLIVVGYAGAQDVPAAIDPALESQMAELEAWTEDERGLTLDTPIERVFPTRDEVRAYIEAQYREQLDPELARRTLAFYQALGIVEPDTDLLQLFIDVLSSQIAGFYDTDTMTMNVLSLTGEGITDGLPLLEEIIYVHEYTHALQDQNFDLDRFIGTDEMIDNPDRALAALALIEGDATATMTNYTLEAMMRDPEAAMALLGESLNNPSLAMPEGIPKGLERELIFPYESGYVFVSALYEEGEWAAVDAAFAQPPTTTEHILHPDTYLADEMPIEIDAVEAVPLDASWEPMWSTTLGEFYLTEHLRTQLGSNDAEEAAEGWGGDHFQVYMNVDGEVAWLLQLAWDTEDDADEFAAAYAEFLNERGGDVNAMATATCYSSDTTICVNVDASVIASAPDEALALELLRAVGG
jgi:hypothetical protein